MRTRFAHPFNAFIWLLALGCNEHGADCEVCTGGCKNGLATMCHVLTPPGCGMESYRQFCPYGCASDTTAGCNTYPVDGAIPLGCVASSVTKLQGALSTTGTGPPAAVTSFLGTETRVVIATSMNAVCGSSSNAGVVPSSGSGAALALSLPTHFAGEAPIGSLARAQLTTWESGVVLIDNQSATAGTVSLNLSQPGGGTMGTYDVTFDASEERGTFVAPACDACAAAQ